MARVKKRIIIWVIVVLVITVPIAFFLLNARKSNTDNGPKTVEVKRETIIQKALAVGSIEPVDEIAVKSKISGVVGKLFADEGDFVQAGAPLLEVKPDPTPLELAEAKRDVELKSIELENLKRELGRQKELKTRGLISDQEYENLERIFDEAKLRHQISSERLALLEKGKVRIANTNIETVVKAPITGYILQVAINQGDPVVPLTSYQAGTDLMKMADMNKLIFKGTVDEIDVGKIQEGLPVELQIGALPGKEIKGKVSLISLKALKEDNTTVFPVEITITDKQESTLRAGFSANANIIIAKKQDVLTIPERVITFRNDSAFVHLPSPEGEPKERFIETGLSDAIQIQVISGLNEGDKVLEKKVKEII
jgi:HlyD family secretion protein